MLAAATKDREAAHRMTAAVSGCSVPSAGSGPLERSCRPASGSGKSLFRSLPLLQQGRKRV